MAKVSIIILFTTFFEEFVNLSVLPVLSLVLPSVPPRMAKPKHKSFPTCFIYEGENTFAEVAVCCLFVTSVLSTFRDVV